MRLRVSAHSYQCNPTPSLQSGSSLRASVHSPGCNPRRLVNIITTPFKDMCLCCFVLHSRLNSPPYTGSPRTAPTHPHTHTHTVVCVEVSALLLILLFTASSLCVTCVLLPIVDAFDYRSKQTCMGATRAWRRLGGSSRRERHLRRPNRL